MRRPIEHVGSCLKQYDALAVRPCPAQRQHERATDFAARAEPRQNYRAELDAPSGCRLRRRLAAEHAIACRGQAADRPVRLDRIVHPRRGPAMGQACFNGLPRYFPAVAIEKRQLSAGLRQSALEITTLRLTRPHAGVNMTRQILARRADAVFAVRCSTHGRPAVNDD
jgi:hypothetical protein